MAFRVVENEIVSEEKKKPVLDEPTLAKLLEAAYVLQEHNREVRELERGLDLRRDQIEAEQKENQKKAESAAVPQATKPREVQTDPHDDYTSTLAQIVSTQHQIQIRRLELDKAMSLVTERVAEIAHASGAAIGMVEGKKVKYRAASGAKTLPVGTEVSVDRALCLPCIKNGQVFRCPDVNPEFLVDTEECRRRGIQSMIAVPIFHEGGAAGGLELYYSAQHGFTEQDVHTCQLMAGLVTEALAREEEHTWKQSLANERAAMLQALEKLKPNLAALVDPHADVQAEKRPVADASGAACVTCGHTLLADEQFCGQCGTPRPGNLKPRAAALPAREIAEKEFLPIAKSHPVEEVAPQLPVAQPEKPEANAVDDQFKDLFATPLETGKDHAFDDFAPEISEMEAPLASSEHSAEEASQVAEEEGAETNSEAEETALAKLTQPADWSSAASAREFLEQLAAGKKRGALLKFWETRRGDIYLAVAIILVLCVIRFGIWSNHPVTATSQPTPAQAQPAPNHAKPAPDATLSYFDRMMISLGLADPPEVPEDKGNPSIQVWVDLHTALYYCPGSDLYGKTPKGKYEAQRDAELDQFQAAYRKPCE